MIDLARVLHWRVAHFRPALTMKGWRTPVSADGAGWPDLILVRGERMIAVELKGSRGRMSTEQVAWHDALVKAGVTFYCWRPEHWPGPIQRVLAA